MPPDEGAPAGRTIISRQAAEIWVAIATFAFGALVVAGSREFGITWSAAGPSAGTFPGFVGLIICAASLVTLAQALRTRGSRGEALLTSVQLRRIAAFAGPMLVFAGAALAVGLYVAATVYLAGVMIWQGRYKAWQAIATGVGASLLFYLVLERWFQVPLLKGPLEAALGIH